MKEIMRHLRSFLAPVLVCIILPAAILWLQKQSFQLPILASSIPWLIVSGLLIAIGLVFLITTIRLFIRIGKGTIMPWDPTRKLVVVGVYRYVRNPMILSLIIVLLGESMLFASYGIAIWAILNFGINTAYFIYSEERGLEKRFGKEYVEYKKNVPRWVPRLRPWKPEEKNE